MTNEINIAFSLNDAKKVDEIKTLYTNIILELAIRQITIKPKRKKDLIYNRSDDEKYILYHHKDVGENALTLKRGYLPEYVYMDKKGYSGWSEFCSPDKINMFKNKINKVNANKAEAFYNHLKEQYIVKRSSKYQQQEEKFDCKDKYVFVALQLPGDMVSRLAYIKTMEMAKLVTECYRNTDTKVVIKFHPKFKEDLEQYAFLKDKNVVKTNANIHDVIPNAEKVYVVNSGVGFESLLYLKHIVVCGACEYEIMGTVAKNKEDLLKTVNSVKPVDDTLIKKYLFFMCKKYFVNCNDSKEIGRRLEDFLKKIKKIEKK